MSEPPAPRIDGAPEAPSLAYADPATPHPQQLTPVSRWDVAVIVVKLVGIYLFIFQGLPYLVAALRSLADGTWRFRVAWLYFYFGVAAAFLAIGAVLFLAAGWLARLLLPKSQPLESLSGAATATTVQEIAFSVVGVYLIVVYALPGFALQGWRWLANTEAQGGTMQTQLPEYGPYVFEHLVQLVVGVVLFKGSKRLSDYWHRVRLHRTASGADDDGPL